MNNEAPVTETPVPEGKIRTVSGRIIDRAKACFLLREDEKHPGILHAVDRSYRRLEDGSLRRLNPKLSRQEKRQMKREVGKEKRSKANA